MFSKIFGSKKGAKLPHHNRTICELHRELYDLIVLGLSETDQKLMMKMIKVLEDAFIMGVKMNKKLVKHKLDSSSKWKEKEYRNKDVNREKFAQLRKDREKLEQMLRYNNEILKKFDKKKKK